MAGEISPDMTFWEGSQNGEIWGADGYTWVAMGNFGCINNNEHKKTRQTPHKLVIRTCFCTV